MGHGNPKMDMFQIWFGLIRRMNGLHKNKFSYYIFAIESMIVVVTPKHFEPLNGLGPLPYIHTHNKIYIQIGI
jgi:hypothetical protein